MSAGSRQIVHSSMSLGLRLAIVVLIALALVAAGELFRREP
jgi:uncharacterized membrane protein